MKRIARWSRQFGIARAVCVVLLLALVPLRLADPPPLEELRLRTFDLFQALRPRVQTTWPVVIVDIDEPSLKQIGQWPWPRTVLADLVTRLRAAGAVAVGFDMVFAEPDRMSPAIAATSFRGIDEATREKLAALPRNDEIFAAAIKQAGGIVVGQAGAGAPEPRSEAEKALQTGFAIRGPDPGPFLVTFPGLLRNILPIEQAAAGRGLFSINPERDGIVRRVPVVMEAQGILVPSLTMEMLRVVTRSGAILIRTDEAGVRSVAVPGLEVPTDRNGQFFIHFNRHDPERYLSAVSVLHGDVTPDRLRGRLVLIGTSAIGLLDIKTTPVEPAMPGVEVHAQILESVLTKSLLTHPGYAIGAELIAAVVFGLAIIIAAPMLPALIVVALGALLIAGFIGLAWYFFIEHHLLIDFTYPLMSSWLIYLVLTFVNYFREQKQRQQIRSAFGFYLSPPLVEQLAKSPEKLVLGGEERRMTILFSDVRGFTTISEHYKDDPQGLTHPDEPLPDPAHQRDHRAQGHDRQIYRRRHHGVLERAARRRGARGQCLRRGTCDAGACRRAQCRTQTRGRSQWRRLHAAAHRHRTQYRAVRRRQYGLGFPLQLFGAGRHRQSRLAAGVAHQGLSPVDGDRLAHRGAREGPVRHHGNRSDPGEGQEAARGGLHRDRPRGARTTIRVAANCATSMRQMLATYRKQDWDEALALIDRCRKPASGFGVAGLYDMYVERIEAYRADPPGADWNGVYEAESK